MHPQSPFWFKHGWKFTHKNCLCQQWLCLDLMMSCSSAVAAESDMMSKISAVTNDTLVPKGYSNFNDPENPGKLVSLDSVKTTNDCINQALKTKDGSEAYRRVMKEIGDDLQPAKAALWEATGGGLSKWWHTLCNAGHFICLVVKCPRCDDYEEMITMQKNLKILIFNIDKRMHDQCIDIFTSSLEIGTCAETTAICRWPIYLGNTAVHKFAARLNFTIHGYHRFQAWTIFEGRAKVRARHDDIWNYLTTGSMPVAELTSDQLEHTSWNHLPTDTVKLTLEENHKAILNASHFEKDPEKEQVEMELIIWPEEIEAIKKMKTWSYAQEIIQGGKVQGMAMFRMANQVIKACNPCRVLDGSAEWSTTADLFLTNGKGKCFVTFDPPFVLRM